MRTGFPLPDTSWAPLRPFWDGAARGVLQLPRCSACGVFDWYPTERCGACGGGERTWTPVSGRATLFSWAVVTHAWMPAFADLVPFVSGLVAIDEDPGVRLATMVVDTDPDDLAIDLPVVVTFLPLTFAGVEGCVTAPCFRA